MRVAIFKIANFNGPLRCFAAVLAMIVYATVTIPEAVRKAHDGINIPFIARVITVKVEFVSNAEK